MKSFAFSKLNFLWFIALFICMIEQVRANNKYAIPQEELKHIKQYCAESEKLIKENQKVNKPAAYVEDGLQFVVFPGVFSPIIHPTPMFSRKVPYQKNSDFLEIGPGVGIVAVRA